MEHEMEHRIIGVYNVFLLGFTCESEPSHCARRNFGLGFFGQVHWVAFYVRHALATVRQ